ncbi:hypothetical protein OSTOST_19599, partial [Ostertagia ostertagi]
ITSRKWITWIYSEWAEDKARKGSRIEDLWQKPEVQREIKAFCLSNLRLLKHVNVSTEGCSAYLLTFGGARRRELIIDLAPPSYPCPDVATLPVPVRKLLSDSVTSSELSIEQRNAVQAAILSTDFTLIEGFPGSGKTTTIVALLRCLLEMNCSVLLATNTHSALDNVLAKLRKYTSGSKILRLGNSPSVRDSVADLTLESKLKGSEEDKYKAARNILKQTPLVASTCHYVPRDVLFSWRKFDYCIIDEASM